MRTMAFRLRLILLAMLLCLGTAAAEEENSPAPAEEEEVVVTAAFLVTTEGGVAEIAVVESSGHDLLDRAAVEAAEKWRYLPARRDGRVVAVRLRRAVRFQLT